MTALRIIKSLKDAGAVIELTKANDLSVVFPKGSADRGLLEQVRKYKQDLVSYLQKSLQINNDIPVCPTSDSYPLSNAQLRLWLIDRAGGDAAGSYVISSAFHIKGSLSLERMQESFLKLVGRHEILRTNFIIVEGEPRQVVRAVNELNFKIEQVAQCDVATMTALAEAPFDLAYGALFRVLISRVDVNEYNFVIAIHHIISDAWSLDLMLRELMSYYEGNSDMQPLRIQYRDFAVWQNEQINSGSFAEHAAYW